MPRRTQLTLSGRTVDRLSVEHKDAIFWDRDLPGFGVRVYPSGRKVFVVQCRGPAGIRRESLVPYGELSCEQARRRARAAAALRLLMVTGCRLTEVLTLQWDDVDRKAGELRLRDAKTGPRMVALTPAALRVLSELRRVPRSRWVFTGRTPDRHLSQLTTYWHQVRARAGVEDVRIHDLRHSFASRALALGEPLPMISRMLGHSKLQSTARYAHLARDSVHESAARVAGSIGADLWADAPAPKR